MTPRSALVDGIRRVGRAPALLAGVWLMTLLVSVPPALALRSSIEEQLDASLEAEGAARGVNYDWMQEFAAQATGAAVTLRPTIIGFGAVLDDISGMLDNVARPTSIVAIASAYVVLWLFLAGGIIDRYASDHVTRSSGFFAACGTYFGRFLRLGVIMLAAYAALFGLVHPWLFEQLYPKIVAGATLERTAFVVRAGLYAVFGVLLGGLSLLFDYAKVRAVVEGRRSMTGAVRAACRFLRRNLSAAVALGVADLGVFIAAVAVYALVAPNAGGTGWLIWVGLAIGQGYILLRLWVKLVFWASETALFEGRSGQT